jgi:hypothetical protein
MINSVRNTVLSILNKSNYGYLSPSDFNLFAKQAQLDIFQDYFYQLNYQISKENVRQSGSGLANISKQYKETIETFAVPPTVLTQDTGNIYFAPSLSTTGSDYFNILNIYVYNTQFTPKQFLAEADKASLTELNALERSLMQAPSDIFPMYAIYGDKIHVFPRTISTVGAVECQYIRYPKDPKWTYVSIGVDGAPVFDQSQPDFQDFELPLDDEVALVVKICQYAGVSIRENEVYQFGKGEETYNAQSEQ